MFHHPFEGKSEYRSDIDGLRALAVICVIINHLSHTALPGGYLGVDIFFVISGYVITLSLEAKKYPTIGTQFLQFYSRRIKRLTPALLVMVIVASSAIRLFDPNAEVSTITGIASIFGVSNLFLFYEATNYFGKSALRNIFSHTWSLGVEEQFYVFYPFIFLWRFRAAGLIALSLLSLLLFAGTYQTNQPAAYFLIPFRFWELGVGCLLGLAVKSSDGKPSARLIEIDEAAALLGILLALYLVDAYPVASTVAIVGCTALLIAFPQHGRILNGILCNSVSKYLGAISYSLYLWHWPVICISYWTIGIHAWSLPFQIGLIFLLSMASYHLVENPLRRAVWIRGAPWKTVAAGGVAMLGVSLLVASGHKYLIPPFAGDRSAETYADAPEPGYVAKYSRRRIDDCFAVTVFAKDRTIPDNLVKCTAETHSDAKLIFVGDSHATDLFPLADRLYHDGIASVVNVFQYGCRMPPRDKEAELCGYLDLILRAFSNSAGTNVLVIRNNYAPRFVNGSLGDFSARLERLLQKTSAAGFKVIYVAPSPKYYSVGPESLCSRQWYRPDWAMGEDCHSGFFEDRSEQLARRRDVTNYLIDLGRKRNDFFVFDPFDVLCGSSEGSCTPLRNGRLIYRDDSHLTEEGSELLVGAFEAFLKSSILTDQARS
jgi:peptidoglycan/LPS O-acetylase OafA/YrhL